MSNYEDDDSRWAAVQSRDPAADRAFVYGVRTTKIYCRPICKARLARRSNVTFYRSPQEAQDAGFRACKRCKPELPTTMPEEDAVRKIREFVTIHRGTAGGGEVDRIVLGRHLAGQRQDRLCARGELRGDHAGLEVCRAGVTDVYNKRQRFSIRTFP